MSIVAGEVPNSELKILNENNRYGFCYELADTEGFDKLCDYLTSMYQEKETVGEISFKPADSILGLFNY